MNIKAVMRAANFPVRQLGDYATDCLTKPVSAAVIEEAVGRIHKDYYAG